MPDKIPLGKPLPLSDDELDALAEVTQEDKDITKKFVRKEGSEKFNDFVDAEEVEE
ncbi:MAG TPA: hypothetical protein VIY48_04255 [Candidatus Paceibacterota bacterium]